MRNVWVAMVMVMVGLCACNKEKQPILDVSVSDLEKQLSPLIQIARDANDIPRSINKDGSVKFVKEGFDWTEGFWSGSCWMLYQLTNEDKWKEEAIRAQSLYVNHKSLTSDHDIGFVFNNSYGKAYRITGKEEYKQVLLDASRSLCKRFNPVVGCIQSWEVNDNWQEKRGWSFPVIVDNMMNLEMLFEAFEITGDSSFYHIAVTHANITMENHFREDGSSYHVVDYNPVTGEIDERVTAQGYANESAWARGQSWGLYGFTMCYRYTHNEKYLDFAMKIADFILNHPNLPEDGIPYWDYNAPDIPNAKRDASAGGIMACALLELCNYTDDVYYEYALKIIKTLSTGEYIDLTGDNAHFLIKHNVGSLPHQNEVDVPLNYADYYYLEALQRLVARDENVFSGN